MKMKSAAIITIIKKTDLMQKMDLKLASLTSFSTQKLPGKKFVISNEVSEAILNTNKRII